MDYTPLIDRKLSLRADKQLTDAPFARRAEREMAGERREESSPPEKSASATVTSNTTERSGCRRLICFLWKSQSAHDGCCITVARLLSLCNVLVRGCSVVVSALNLLFGYQQLRPGLIVGFLVKESGNGGATWFCFHYS